jgi:hypothetical protein
VYKNSIGSSGSNSISLDADLRYLGIETYQSNSFISMKSSKNHQLTKREEAYNKKLAKRRVLIKHINCKIKTYKSMAYHIGAITVTGIH